MYLNSVKIYLILNKIYTQKHKSHTLEAWWQQHKNNLIGQLGARHLRHLYSPRIKKGTSRNPAISQRIVQESRKGNHPFRYITLDCIISGARYSGVPHNVHVLSVITFKNKKVPSVVWTWSLHKFDLNVRNSTLAKPKSVMTMCPCLSSSKFSGFKSLTRNITTVIASEPLMPPLAITVLVDIDDSPVCNRERVEIVQSRDNLCRVEQSRWRREPEIRTLFSNEPKNCPHIAKQTFALTKCQRKKRLKFCKICEIINIPQVRPAQKGD